MRKNKIIAILLLIVLIASLIPTTFVYADDPKVTVTVAPDKTTAKPGDEITYSIKMSTSANISMTAVSIELDIPNTLTYVANSGKMNNAFRDKLGITFNDFDFTEASKIITMLTADYPYITNLNDDVVATFSCKVNDTTTSGNHKIALITEFSEINDPDGPGGTAPTTGLIADADVSIVAPETTISIPATGISLDKTTLNMTAGSTEKLTATVAPTTATNKNVSWKSSNDTIASVDASGNVTAKKAGTATITATSADGSFTATCAVTVTCAHTNKTTHPAVASNCLVQGHDTYETCNDCGEIVSGSDAKLPLGAHNYGTLIPEVPAVHTPDQLSEGKKAHYVCSVCNKKFNEAYAEAQDSDLVIPAPEHTYAGDWVATDSTTVPNSNANVDTNEYHWKNCGCGNIIQEKHKGGEATCNKKAVCTVCSAEYGNLDNTNHKHTEIRNDQVATCTVDGYTGDKYCSDCNTKLETGKVIPAAHKGGEATCISKAVCEVCSQEYGDLDSSNHKNVELKNKKDATCTEDGYTGDKFCNDCNTEIEKGKVIPAGHKGGKATCVSKAVCEVCNKEYGEVDPNNHVNTIVKDKKDATKEKEGYTGDVYCKDCKKVVKKGTVIAKLKDESKPLQPQQPGQGGGDSVGGVTPTANPAPASSATVSGVQTGDNSNLILWSCLLVVSGIGFIVIRKWQKNLQKTRKH